MVEILVSQDLPDSIRSALGDLTFMERAAVQALRQAGAPLDGELTIVLSDDAQLQQLNSQFLQIDAPTDVLSFPSGEPDPDSGASYLGDVLISYPRALAQASARGHTVRAELQLLVVHGVLHLLGHDHAGQDDKARMWALQAEILQSLGVAVDIPDS